jgi:phosphomannomutase/phosphomannomutase/phosphoglucomutase
MRLYPASGEINREIADVQGVIARIRQHYEPLAKSLDLTDGLSLEFDAWRFNLRGSNTEPLVRLNVESRGNEALMREKTAEILRLVDAG